MVVFPKVHTSVISFFPPAPVYHGGLVLENWQHKILIPYQNFGKPWHHYHPLDRKSYKLNPRKNPFVLYLQISIIPK